MKVGDDRLGLLLYADDVVLLSESSEDLQRMLDITTEYGMDFNVKFSSEKSQVMVVNGEEIDKERTWTLAGEGITRTRQYKYLGMRVDEKGCEGTKDERIARANQWWGRLGSVARCRANKYEVVRGVWKGMAVPSLLYGLETIPWTVKDIDKLEMVQRRVGRLTLGANKYVAVEAIRGDMGWSTFKERIDKGILGYILRLEEMEERSWARKVYEFSKDGSRWSKMCRRLERRYDGQIRLGRQEVREGGTTRMKREINKCVQRKGWEEWRQGMREKTTLEWYRTKEVPGREWLYDGSLGGDLIFKARTKSLELNSRVYRWRNEGSSLCRMCEAGVDETVDHLLLECVCYDAERNEMVEGIDEEVGRGEWGRLQALGNGRVIEALLGLSDSKAWNNATGRVKEYLERVWRKRSQRVETANPE